MSEGKNWRAWTEHELRRLEQLRLDGLNSAQIARELGRPHGSVRARLSEEGFGYVGVTIRWLNVLSRPHTMSGAAAAMNVSKGAVKRAGGGEGRDGRRVHGADAAVPARGEGSGGGAVSKKKDDDLLYVNVCEPEPNPLFTEEQRAWTRFLIYNRAVECAECGKKRKKMWTQLFEFRAATMRDGEFALRCGPTVHPPLTPVCDDHLLSPGWSDEVLAEMDAEREALRAAEEAKSAEKTDQAK